MRVVIFGLLIVLAIVHQDWWWRYDHRTLVLNFLPVSMAYHIGISIAASALWGLACYYCWPKDVDVADRPGETP